MERLLQELDMIRREKTILDEREVALREILFTKMKNNNQKIVEDGNIKVEWISERTQRRLDTKLVESFINSLDQDLSIEDFKKDITMKEGLRVKLL